MNNMEFYELEEVNRMAKCFVRKKELYPGLDIIEDAKQYVKECQNIEDASNSLKYTLDALFLNEQKNINKYIFKANLYLLFELTYNLLNNIVIYNFDFDTNDDYEFDIDIDSKEEAIEVYKKYIYETHSIDGSLNKLYQLSATLNNLTILYLEKFYDEKFNDKFVDGINENLKENIFFKDINKDDINELYNSFNEKILTAIKIVES